MAGRGRVDIVFEFIDQSGDVDFSTALVAFFEIDQKIVAGRNQTGFCLLPFIGAEIEGCEAFFVADLCPQKLFSFA